MKKSVFAVIPVAAVAMGVVGCSSDSTAEPVAEPSPAVTEIDYGQQYLAIVCPANILADTLDKNEKKWFGSDGESYYGEPVPSAYKKWAAKRAVAEKKSAQQLDDAEWPEEIQKSIDVIAQDSYAYVDFYKSRAKANDSADWEDSAGVKTSKQQKAVADVRLTLDLPPSGKGCKAYKKN